MIKNIIKSIGYIADARILYFRMSKIVPSADTNKKKICILFSYQYAISCIILKLLLIFGIKNSNVSWKTPTVLKSLKETIEESVFENSEFIIKIIGSDMHAKKPASKKRNFFKIENAGELNLR